MNTRQLDEMETSAWGRDSLTTNSFPSTFSTLAILNPLEELEVPIHLRNDILYNDRDIQQSSRLEDLMIDPELVNPCHFENSSFKPPISFYPPIWTQVRTMPPKSWNLCSFNFSPDRNFASRSIGFVVTKVVYIMLIMW